jgi:glycogen operon protein
MTDQEWNQEFARCLGLLLSGDAADETDERGQRIRDGNFIILMNAHHDEIPFTLPILTASAGWITLVDTSCQTSQGANTFYSPSKAYPLQARSFVLLVERTLDRIRADDRRRAQLP